MLSQSPHSQARQFLSRVWRAAGMLLRFKIKMIVVVILLVIVLVLATVDLVENNVLACWAAFLLAYLVFHLPLAGKWLRSRTWLHNAIDQATLILGFLTVISSAAGDEQQREDQRRAQNLATITRIVTEHRELLAEILRLECGEPYQAYRETVIVGVDREIKDASWNATRENPQRALPTIDENADLVSERIDPKWRTCYYADQAQEAIRQGWFYLDENNRPGTTDEAGLPDFSEIEDRRPIGVMPTFGRTYHFKPMQEPYIQAYPTLHVRMISSMRSADLSHADDHQPGRLLSTTTVAELDRTSAHILDHRTGSPGPGMAPYLAFLLSISAGASIALFRSETKKVPRSDS